MATNSSQVAAFVCFAALTLGGCSKPSERVQPEAKPVAEAAVQAGTNVVAAPPTANPEHVLWGDEHIHTGWSADAGLGGATLSPEDAVRFAQGAEVKSSTGQMAKLKRPLDWIAVTDHSDGMGTINQLRDGNAEFLADPRGKRWHDMMNTSIEEGTKATMEAVKAQSNQDLPKVFMDPKWMLTAWEKTVDVMEKYNHPGNFTAFIAYEWTSNGTDGNNMHRNVIFRDGADKTRAYAPLTTFVGSDPSINGSDPESLWNWLSNWEAKTGGHVLAIPHNGNLSNGQMFEEKRYNGEPLTQKWVEDRARFETLYEVYQFKGQSEAHPSLSPTDEYAKFGVWDTANLAGVPKKPGQIKTEYARQALQAGLRLQNQFGTNPFKLGLVAGTDTHNGLSTGADESDFWGKFPAQEPKADRWSGVYQKTPTYTRLDWTLLAAGVTGVWATANTREAIWDAMKRRETYASSGPRITLRFFGGYHFTDDDAKAPTLAVTGYARGVPMGGDLQATPSGKAPTFLFAAMKDPLGANLDSMQIVKGWVDASGATHERVLNVAWSETDKRKEANGRLTPVGNTVDLATATYTNSIGATELIGSFTDPQFDPTQRAFYYVRAVEIPTPRWTAYDAVKYKVKMASEVEMIQQERAVSSPIWYNPS